jgi:hypothetical protein
MFSKVSHDLYIVQSDPPQTGRHPNVFYCRDRRRERHKLLKRSAATPLANWNFTRNLIETDQGRRHYDGSCGQAEGSLAFRIGK